MLKKLPSYYLNALYAVLMIFALTLIGWGISILIGSLIPMWLLIGFSVFYSIEKWLLYYVRTYKTIGIIYRLLLNLSVVLLLILIIWSGISLFSQQFIQSPLIGSLVFLVEIVAFIWLCRVVAKNSRKKPSMKLTVFSLICMFIIFAFAGVQPMTEYKNQIFAGISSIFSGFEGLSSFSKPPASEYPADVIGRVVMTTTVQSNDQEITVPNKSGMIYWIVDITAKNKSYEQPVTDKQWVIVTDEQEYKAHGSIGEMESSYPATIIAGETGETIIRFAVPDTLSVHNAKLCYQGQQPFSLGRLTGGNEVVAYDWESKTSITKLVKVVEDWEFQLDDSRWRGGTLTVQLKITNLGPRRNFGLVSFMFPGPELVAIDSTNKMAEPWVLDPDFSKGELFRLPPYTKEYYSNESWSGSLRFEMSPYSGETRLYMTRFTHTRKYFLFNVGEPE